MRKSGQRMRKSGQLTKQQLHFSPLRCSQGWDICKLAWWTEEGCPSVKQCCQASGIILMVESPRVHGWPDLRPFFPILQWPCSPFSFGSQARGEVWAKSCQRLSILLFYQISNISPECHLYHLHHHLFNVHCSIIGFHPPLHAVLFCFWQPILQLASDYCQHHQHNHHHPLLFIDHYTLFIQYLWILSVSSAQLSSSWLLSKVGSECRLLKKKKKTKALVFRENHWFYFSSHGRKKTKGFMSGSAERSQISSNACLAMENNNKDRSYRFDWLPELQELRRNNCITIIVLQVFRRWPSVEHWVCLTDRGLREDDMDHLLQRMDWRCVHWVSFCYLSLPPLFRASTFKESYRVLYLNPGGRGIRRNFMKSK